jgi:adhesin/invasin
VAIASGEGTLTGTTTVATDASGQATFTDLAISGSVGDRTLSFSAGSLTPATSETITLSAGPATQMGIIAGDNQSAVAGTAVATAPSVIVGDDNDNLVAGVDVTFTVESGGGSVTGAVATTNASGIATVGSWTLGETAGTNTLTASAPGLPDVTFTATGTAGTATQMAINAGDGQSATAGTAVATAPSVIVRDTNGNPVAGVDVTFAVASGGGSVTGASATTNASGIATVGGWTLGTTAGTNTLTATAPSLTGSPLTFTATGTAGAATQMAINAGDGQSATAGTAVATAPSVIVRDANDNPVEGVSVTFAVASGGGSVTGASATTNASGIATVGGWNLGTTAGTNTLTATAPGLTGSPLTFTATGTAGTATQMVINAGDGQSATAGTAIATAPSVIVRDTNDNPVEGVEVTFAVASGGGSVTGASATTNASGIATVGGWTLGTTAGTNTLTATAPGLTGSPLTFSATGTAGAATQMAINAGDGQSATGGTAVAVAPSVLVTDANDNPVEGVSVTFDVASGDGTIDPTTPVATDANGIATVNSWTLGETAGTNTLTASAAGLPDVTFSATGTAGAATQMAINAGDGQSATGGTAVAVAPSVLVTDANDNPVEGVSVTFDVASGDGTIDPTTPVATDANGIATVNSWTLGDTAGTNTLTASAAGLPDVTFSATGTAGAATQMAINAGDGQSATGGTAVAVAPSVLVTDANDNPVEGVSVTFAVASGDGTIDPTTPVATDANGIATVNSWTLGDTAGTNTLTAIAAGLPDVTFTASATTAPAAPTDVSATPGDAEATVSWTAPTETGGSAITGYTVTGDPGGSCSVAGDVSECTITGLTNGTEYTFTVVATNDEGNSLPSLASESVTPVGPPGGALQAQVEPTLLGLVVSWVAPSDNGGTPMLSYRADANPSCEVTALADEVPGETAYSCTIGNLDPGQEYTVTVTAINAVGESMVVAGAVAPLRPVIPVPTLGAWALFSLMLLMLLMAMPVLLRRKFQA